MAKIKPEKFTLLENKIIIIRNAVTKDAKQLHELMFNISKEQIYSVVEADEFKETISSYRKKIKRFKMATGKLYIIAEYRRKITGLLQFSNYEFKKCRHNGILTIFISKRWRRKGIGSMLISELLRWAEQNPIIKKISLSVFSNNTRAISLYKKAGFIVEGRCRKEIKINSRYMDNILMYKWIGN